MLQLFILSQWHKMWLSHAWSPWFATLDDNYVSVYNFFKTYKSVTWANIKYILQSVTRLYTLSPLKAIRHIHQSNLSHTIHTEILNVFSHRQSNNIGILTISNKDRNNQ